MGPYAFVDGLGCPSVVGEPIASDLQAVGMIQRGLRRRALQRYAPEQRLKADATDRLVQLVTLYAEGFDLFGEDKYRRGFAPASPGRWPAR